LWVFFFSRLNVDLLTWQYLHEEVYPLSGVGIKKLDFIPHPADAAGLSRKSLNTNYTNSHLA